MSPPPLFPDNLTFLFLCRCEYDELRRIPPSKAPAVLRLEDCDGGGVVHEPEAPPPSQRYECCVLMWLHTIYFKQFGY